MHKPIIEVKDVSFQYQDREVNALTDVSISINQGEWIAIVGHNGSGKSTLAKLLIGLYFPSSGTITVAGYPLNEQHVWDIRKQVGIVFQNPDNQFVGTTVQDDVAFGLENAGIARGEMVSRVYKSLEMVKMLDFLNQEPHNLSGGQKQRVAIAGIIALQPQVIILDEATSMLDPSGRQELLSIIQELKQEKKITILSITHDMDEAIMADRMFVLNQGQVFAEGVPLDIFKDKINLGEIGLDYPFVIKVSEELRQKGIEINTVTSMEELVAQLTSLNFKE